MSQATLIAVASAISAAIALCAFLFTVVDGFVSRRRESNRRDWERLQVLAQIMHQGPEAGLWAQKMAIQELKQLKTKRIQVLPLAKEAMDWWNKYPSVDPSLKAELQNVINQLSRQLSID